MSTSRGPHERDIPSLAAIAPQVSAVECDSRLSFAIASSLAVAKRLTWAQTPCLNSPLSLADSKRISEALSLQTNQNLPTCVIQNALYFGSTYMDDEFDTSRQAYPEIFIVFPHLQRAVSRDTSFIETWHNIVVRPAFKRAWEDSGLVEVWPAGRTREVREYMSMPGGTEFETKDIRSSQGLINYLGAGRTEPLEGYWPSWTENWGEGLEGKHSDKREQIYDDAWHSIAGMLNGQRHLEELQEPILLVVYRGHTMVNAELGIERIYESIGRQMDRTLDSRYIEEGSLRIVVETVLCGRNWVRETVEKQDKEKEEQNGKNSREVDFKRTSEGGPDPEAGNEKRRKKISLIGLPNDRVETLRNGGE